RDETLIQVLIQDITEKKEADLKLQKSEEELKILNRELEKIVLERTKELRESERKYRHLYENSPFSIALLNTKGKIIDVNSKTSKLFGYKKEDLIGKNYLKLSKRPTLLNTRFKSSLISSFKSFSLNKIKSI
ncbi:unnamed protein product, partial [marine sediment metagenome]